MKKILYFTLSVFLYVQNSFASQPSAMDINFEPDSNRLETVLTQILDGVAVKVEGEKVVLTGIKNTIEAAVAKLRDFKGLRGVLMPVRNDKALTSAQAMTVDTWDDFLKAAGIDDSENELFNTRAKCVIDKGGMFTIETKNSTNLRMLQAYLDSLHESSQFFAWARKNIPAFIHQDKQRTIINYALLREFLYLNAAMSPTTNDSEVVTASFTAQNVVKTLIAAVSGNIALQPVSEGKYRVQTLSLGQNFDVRDVVLELMIDNSGSMSGSSINFVNSKLPQLLHAAKAALFDRQSLTVRLKTFNTVTSDVGTYVITNNAGVPHIPLIVTDGGTDLTLIEPLLNERGNERKLVIAFTDGEHASNENLVHSISRMKALVKTGKFAKARLCKVGPSSSAYFDQVADIFGGTYSTEGNIENFFNTIGSQLSSLMKSRAPLVIQLAGADVSVVEWVPDDAAGIFSSTNLVGEGASVKFKDATHLVEKPVVPKADLIAKLEEALAALKQQEKENN